MIRGEPVDGVQEITYTLDPAGTPTLRRTPEPRPPGTYRLRIDNRSSESFELALARQKVLPWVSGAMVASNPTFRDLFSTELIDPDQTIAVRNMTFLFTDIKGSTGLYERRGDGTAYALVKRHFGILGATIAHHRGAIVKTIGDAVMATFPVALDGFEAAVAMHAAIAAFNADNPAEPIHIKIGVHRGPCLAVTSNDRIDYFGRTVNLAARVQGLSGGDDIVLSAATAAEGAVGGAVASCGWTRIAFTAQLRGIDGPTDVVRLVLD
jgi:class 3 adenylate cyclase